MPSFTDQRNQAVDEKRDWVQSGVGIEQVTRERMRTIKMARHYARQCDTRSSEIQYAVAQMMYEESVAKWGQSATTHEHAEYEAHRRQCAPGPCDYGLRQGH